MLVSGSSKNDGETRNASNVASATSAGVPAGVPWPSAWKRATSSVVSGRRKALRPNVWMVCVRQPDAAGSQVMKLAFNVGSAMTALAIAAPTSW